MPSAALTCSWESRGKSEQSCSAPTESEEGRSQQPDPKTGITLQPRGKNPEPGQPLPQLLPQLPPLPLPSAPWLSRHHEIRLCAGPDSSPSSGRVLGRFSVSRCAFYPRRVVVFGAHPFQSAGVGRKRQNKKSAADSFASSRTSALIGPLTILREAELTTHPCPL